MKKRKLYPTALTEEYKERIGKIAVSGIDLIRKYRQMNTLLHELLDLLTADVPYTMSGAYARVSYVTDVVCPTWGSDIRQLRMRCRYRNNSNQNLAVHLNQDLATLRQLAKLLSEEGAEERISEGKGRERIRNSSSGKMDESPWEVMRVCVDERKGAKTFGATDIETDNEETVNLEGFEYLLDWIKKGTRLNLIYRKKGEDIQLQMVVYEPDCIIDVTTVCGCYTAYTTSERLHTIKSLLPNKPTMHTLLGNLAGQFLDESLADMRDGREPQLNYTRSLRHFFRRNALDIAVTEGLDNAWHGEAKNQQAHVAECLKTLKESDPNYRPELASTEATLLCADLGLRGRTDLLQSDWNLLIEQKSGKMDTFRRIGAREEHYVQMMLYKTMLSVCYGGDRRHSSQYFLYSKYADCKGLIREGESMSATELRLAIQMRNAIARNLMRYTNPAELRQDLMSWRVESFRTKDVSDRLWEPYSKPELESALLPIQTADPLTRAYLFEMLAFMHREDMATRIGTSQHGREGFANLWNSESEDRINAGEMIAGLRFDSMDIDAIEDENGECSLLTMSRERSTGGDTEGEPNFRIGDPVNLYDYPTGGTPNILTTITHRATLIEIREEPIASSQEGKSLQRLTFKLRSAQPPALFEGGERLWAIDHDAMGSSSSRQMAQMTNLLRTTAERRDLLLGRREPLVDADKMRRIGDYGKMNDLVDRQLAARDMFLLVGPPGTGKTSVGLMNILREELAHEGHSVLLLSYTNRAVDEICSKLEKDGLDYLRIGSRYGCAAEYRDRLMISIDFPRVDDIRQKIRNTRIIAGTTASISNAAALFELKRFDLAIVDEASQILEPSIIGILSETGKYGTKTMPSIGRFVLIGDQKQLPAVVQQNKAQSKVTDEQLTAVGLTDCRDSFFERMIRLHGRKESLVYRLTQHGRMHPEVAEFSNRMFYGGMLTPIPLPHQSATLSLGQENYAEEDPKYLLSSRRTLYIDSHDERVQSQTDKDKENPHEADIVAKIAIMILEIYRKAGKRVDPQTVGIVVPYRNQIAAIRSRIMTLKDIDEELHEVACLISIDTVERYQGSEREVIIYGLTAMRTSQMEFLKDGRYDDPDGMSVDRKLNVALTRAREQLIVVGDSKLIATDALYEELRESLNKGIDTKGEETLRQINKNS